MMSTVIFSTGENSDKSARDMSGKKLTVETPDKFSALSKKNTTESYALALSKIEKNITAPTDAKRCEGCYYRIANGNPVTTEDFFSQRKMQPDKVFKGLGIDECVTRAVSLFSEREEAEKRLKLPKFKKANIALVILEPKDGVLKKLV